MIKRVLKVIGIVILSLIALPFVALGVSALVPSSQVSIPVGNHGSYNPKSFWHPWGDHKHRGVDLFAKSGTEIKPAAPGVVLFTSDGFGAGGRVAAVLGPAGRIYYYAHMDEVMCHPLQFVTSESVIGTVGNSGNAKNTPSHLHFSIISLWKQTDHCEQDARFKIWCINPVVEFKDAPNY